MAKRIKVKSNRKQTIIIHETLLESWLKDLFTYGGLFLLFYLNHKFIDGLWLLDSVILIFFVLLILGSSGKIKKDFTIKEAIKYLENLDS